MTPTQLIYAACARAHPSACSTYVIIAALITLFSLHDVGCRAPNEPKPPEPISGEPISHGILPLKVGYLWNYTTYYWNGDTSTGQLYEQSGYIITRFSPGPAATDSFLIFHRATLNPRTGGQSDFEWFFSNYAGGLYNMGGKIPPDSMFTKLLLLKYPVTKGESWFSPHLVYDPVGGKFSIPDSILYTCTDTNARFDTPGGSFSLCVVYHHLEKLEGDVISMHEYYDYYVYDVGMVGGYTYSFFPLSGTRYPTLKSVLVATNVPLP